MTPPTPTPLLSLHQLSLYNPGRMPPEQIIAAFAARRQQLDRIVVDLAAEKPKSRAQHHLIVGQRGMGKTMLLARIAAELRTSAELAARFIPLVFAEEQYAVDRLSKFWLNCLDSLADARELAKDTEGVAEIDTTVARLTAAGMRAAKDDQPFADEVYEAFGQVAKASGQRPVLLVDSLQLVFERLDNGQQHSLRELLMRPGSPILVGASPSPPPQSQDYGAAFYDQFKVHYLRPLDESEMRALLVHLAEAARRDDVRQRVLQHPARLTVLRQLTGGNPRTALTLFFLYAEDFAPNVFGDLENLLDRVTPLYKARFEELTAQQQVVASAIANHWDPVTAARLAADTGLPAGTISAQLDRLEKTGVVERTELFGQTSTGYQLAERFFNIWFLMRSASRRQRREVEFLTRFLQSFYEPADRTRLARHLMGEGHFTPDRYVWSRAVAASLTDTETVEELIRYAEAETAYREAIARDPKNAWPWNDLGTLYCDHLDRPSDAAEAYDNALRLDPTNDVVFLNRIFLRRDFMGEGPGARPLMNELRALPKHECPDTTYLQEALFAAYDSNWGLACEALAKALTIRANGFSSMNTDDWLRASAVLLHLNYGAELLAFLDQRGDTARLRPWVEAVRAHHLGDRRALQNIAPEIRTAAEIFYDGIESRLKKLPEKTRRRPLAKPKRTRSGRL
jgi:tetratricopeptide (TPR) repeat protein